MSSGTAKTFELGPAVADADGLQAHRPHAQGPRGNLDAAFAAGDVAQQARAPRKMRMRVDWGDLAVTISDLPSGTTFSGRKSHGSCAGGWRWQRE